MSKDDSSSDSSDSPAPEKRASSAASRRRRSRSRRGKSKKDVSFFKKLLGRLGFGKQKMKPMGMAIRFGDKITDFNWEEDGKFDKEDLEGMMDVLNNDDLEKRLWELMDRNKDGNVSATEFRLGLMTVFNDNNTNRRVVKQWAFWVFVFMGSLRLLKILKEMPIEIGFIRKRSKSYRVFWRMCEFMQSIALLMLLLKSFGLASLSQKQVMHFMTNKTRFRTFWQETYKIREALEEHEKEQAEKAEVDE